MGDWDVGFVFEFVLCGEYVKWSISNKVIVVLIEMCLVILVI